MGGLVTKVIELCAEVGSAEAKLSGVEGASTAALQAQI